ncbi:hypothetical protein CEXT_186101 [Caerostris extrusa]|uniref:Uncharacterized protein n=1 Tax=Caerostris extrusa TaxID=172846 RepID=A0AAV4TVQ4_CAEEX|nr:hypothetical protein CEXT_186101 [Caerostris extrusa]
MSDFIPCFIYDNSKQLSSTVDPRQLSFFSEHGIIIHYHTVFTCKLSTIKDLFLKLRCVPPSTTLTPLTYLFQIMSRGFREVNSKKISFSGKLFPI